MQTLTTYQYDYAFLRRLAGTLFIAVAIVLAVVLSIHYLSGYRIVSVNEITPIRTTVSLCTAINDECGDISLQEVSDRIYGTNTPSATPDVWCEAAKKNNVSCEDMKSIGRAYFELNHPEVLK